MNEIKFPLLLFGEEELVQDIIRKVTDKYPSVVRVSIPNQMLKKDGEVNWPSNLTMLIKPETIFEVDRMNVGDWRDTRTWKYNCMSYDENMNIKETIEIKIN